MLKTVVWFTAGGLFSALLSNSLRGLPLLRRPLIHIGFTLAGFWIGTKVSKFEDTFEERMTKALETQKHTDWYPRGVLLAQRAKALGITVTTGDGVMYKPDGTVEDPAAAKDGGEDVADDIDEEEIGDDDDE